MRLLILGGTRFVGLHITQAALERNHDVTLFNRGRTNPELFTGVERVVGDRDGGLDALRGRRWDLAIDVNGYLPRLVHDSAAMLRDAVPRYLFISTLAVYATFTPGQDEGAPLATLANPMVETITDETYGPLKALCEAAVREFFPQRHIILRPGFIIGPHDHTGRFTYWARRIRKGGEVLAPGSPDNPFQAIDARDLAAFALQLSEAEITDIYNVIGPERPTTWREVLETCREVVNRDARLTWVSEEFLHDQQVDPDDLPLWPPADLRGLMQFDCRKAQRAGLTYRPLAVTIEAIDDWDRAHGGDLPGLDPAHEARLLAAWHAHKS